VFAAATAALLLIPMKRTDGPGSGMERSSDAQHRDQAAAAAVLERARDGLCFVALATHSDSAYSLLAGAVAQRLKRGVRQKRVSGAAYIGLGALTALSPA
jgi:hypothetical protein